MAIFFQIGLRCRGAGRLLAPQARLWIDRYRPVVARSFFAPRLELMAEVLALRQQWFWRQPDNYE
jgi:hypothetical protein